MSQSMQKKPPSELKVLSDFLEGRKSDLAMILPEGLSPERTIKAALMAAVANPAIVEKCTIRSIYQCVMNASLLGLTVGGGNQEAYLIPYKDVCTLSIGYRGWVKCALRSPDIDIIRSSVVYEGDQFLISEFPPACEHTPLHTGDRGDYIGALAAAYRIKDGQHELFDFTFMTANELGEAQSMAERFKPSPAWQKWPDEMRKKAAIRRLCKMLPTNPELDKLRTYDTEPMVNAPATAVTVDSQLQPLGSKKTATDKLKENLMIEAQKEDDLPPPEIIESAPGDDAPVDYGDPE